MTTMTFTATQDEKIMNFDDAYSKIREWTGSFNELVDHLTAKEYEFLMEAGVLDYTDEDWMEEHFEDKQVFLANFIGDWLMSCIANGDVSNYTENLYRLWKQGI